MSGADARSPADIAVPEPLAWAARRYGHQAWLQALPRRVREAAERWDLRLGDPFVPGGHTSWVAPAGPELVLKVGIRHAEGEHEPEGLAHWDGHGSVRLHAVHRTDDTVTLLLERCHPGSPLADRHEDEHHDVIAGLLQLLRDRPAPPPGHPFRPLAALCRLWGDALEATVAERGPPAGVDPALARAALDVFRELPAGSRADDVLLCTDLHAGNVLAAARAPWLVIDPKPYVGDRAYDVVQHLLNCKALHDAPERLVHRMASALDLDAARVAAWTFARCVQESFGQPQLAAVARRLAPP